MHTHIKQHAQMNTYTNTITPMHVQNTHKNHTSPTPSLQCSHTHTAETSKSVYSWLSWLIQQHPKAAQFLYTSFDLFKPPATNPRLLALSVSSLSLCLRMSPFDSDRGVGHVIAFPSPWWAVQQADQGTRAVVQTLSQPLGDGLGDGGHHPDDGGDEAKHLQQQILILWRWGGHLQKPCQGQGRTG